MSGAVTYHQQVSYCGKPHCRKCREGIGHGPYWYAYQTVNGRTVRTYVGKHPPAGVQPSGVSGEGRRQLPSAIRAAIRVSTFGGSRLWCRSHNWQWQVIPDGEWLRSPARPLLNYLISCPGRQVSRAQLFVALWPGLVEDAADLQFGESIATLRQLLAPPRRRKGQGDMVVWNGEWLGLAGQSQVWVDADAFEALLSQARTGSDPGQTEQLLEEALLLYGGDYLSEERDTPRIQARRESLQHSWIGLLLELADLYIAREALSSAIDILDRLLVADPANEAAVHRLVILLAQAGRRAEALRVYQRCVDALEREFGIRPSGELQRLYEMVRRGEDIRPLG